MVCTERPSQERHKQSRWGMDFYGVGDGYVLGLIDLDSLWVELVYLDSRAAEGVEMAIRDRILFRHGTPDQIQSDHAREFIGRFLTNLANKHGYMNTTTGGYCPTGNATIESFWSFLGTCTRSLSDDEYAEIEKHLQRMAWAWNVTESESLSVAPFQVMTGTHPRTIPATAMRSPWGKPPDHDPGTEPLDPKAIADSTSEYIKIAAEHADFMRTRRSTALNKKGRVLRALDIGDHVKIYAPPGHEEALRRKRKAKHMFQFRGPLRIVDKPTPSTFVLEDRTPAKKRYRRHISNLRRWIGPLPDVTAPQDQPVPIGQEDIEVGDFIATAWDDASTDVAIAKVTDVDDSEIRVWCWGSTAKNQMKARFKPVYTSIDKNKRETVHLGKPRVAAMPFTWGVPLKDVTEDVRATALTMQANGALTATAQKKMRAIQGARIHRFKFA